MQSLSNAGYLWVGFQFGALQNLQGLAFVFVFFGLVPNRSIFCIGSSFISFSRLVIKASGIVFFRFFLWYVFCLIISIVFFESSFFSFIGLSRSFESVIAVIIFEMSKSSAVIPSNAHSFSISISRRQKPSGVSVSVCFVQKNSSRLWYEFRFGRKYSLNSRIRSFTAFLSGSILYYARVIWYNSLGPMPHMKSSCISVSFPVQPFCVISTPRINSLMSILYFLFVYCRNLLSHCFGVKTRFPSDVASKFVTSFCFVSVVIFFVPIKFSG